MSTGGEGLDGDGVRTEWRSAGKGVQLYAMRGRWRGWGRMGGPADRCTGVQVGVGVYNGVRGVRCVWVEPVGQSGKRRFRPPPVRDHEE